MVQEIKKSEGTTTPSPRYSDTFSALRAEMDHAFSSFLDRNFSGFPSLSRAGWGEMLASSIDLREAEKEFVVEAELPGMNEKDVSVTLSNGVLTLKGEKKSEREEKKENYHLMERNYGSFHRSFQLGDAVDPDKVSATFDKGVLKITLAKRAEAAKAEKKIPISKG
jgi:HSP20 family protein